MISFKNVTKNYGDVIAVKDLDLEISPGELFGFIGPNGAGKTTTIKMITGLIKPTRGKVFLKGINVQQEPERAKQLVGYIPDSPFIYERLTGREFLHLVGGLYKMDRKTIEARMEWLFDLFGIDEWRDFIAAEYSHGMKQKVVFASALVHDPEIIVIDEPMVGLDPQSQKLVKEVLRKLAERGITVFMSTHTLAVAQEICTRIGVINHGKLLKLGTLDEIRKEARMEGKNLEDLFLSLTGGQREVWFPEPGEDNFQPQIAD
ncbi:ABC transporter ATP-binding protein [bacterium]|nr:ABC transporter ATP-binding protein [bacterium]